MKLKVILKAVFVFGFLISSMAFSKPAVEAKSNLLDYKQFIKLTRSQKTTYLKILQDFLVRGDFGKDSRLKASLIRFFIETSSAAEVSENSVCIFAGYLQTMKQAQNGHWYCPKPPQGSCEKGEVQCNPLVFGRNACVGKYYFPNATEECRRISTKDLKLITSYYDETYENYDPSLAAGWNYLQEGIADYCKDPFPFNKENCNSMQDQIKILKEEINPTHTKAIDTKPGATGGK